MLQDVQTTLQQGRSKREFEGVLFLVRRELERRENAVAGLFQHPAGSRSGEMADTHV
jgi:hypothetical protein